MSNNQIFLTQHVFIAGMTGVFSIIESIISQEFQSFDFGKGVRWTWFILALFTAGVLTRIAETKARIHSNQAYAD